MMQKFLRYTFILWLAFGLAGVKAQTIDPADIIIRDAPETQNVCTFEPTDYNADRAIAHADIVGKTATNRRTSSFNVTYVSECGADTWPPEALAAFEYAMSIWETHLESEIPVRIQATWQALDENVLGNAGPTRIAQIPSVGLPDTWYSIAQASAMTGQDIVGSTQGLEFDIVININCEFSDWYFNQDANPPADLIDFVTVVLHEIGHGIGFIGSMTGDEDIRIAEWGFTGSSETPLPIAYDLFSEDGDGISLINESVYPQESAGLYDALTGEFGGVFFDGLDANNVNAGIPVQLYSPLIWQPGSSYSHLDQDTFGQSDNSLMRPRLDRQFAIHSPGSVMCGILSDMGWPLGQNCFDLLGVDSEILVAQAGFEFGIINVGDTEGLTLTISNNPSASETLTGSVLIENSNFNIPFQNRSFDLAPGNSIDIPVIYRPRNVAEHTAELTIIHNSRGIQNPTQVPLRGEALEENRIFVLDQNYPNPFNAQTRIEYALTGSSDVLLEVYNMAGRLVATLQDGEQSEGRYKYEFSAGQLASGVYLYRIIVDGKADTKKLLIVK